MKLTKVLIAPALLLLTTAPVLGQQDIETGGLEEVVVTARRITENLQKVPVSITAFGANDISAANISSPEDIAALTPGFSYRAADRGFALPVIRGMSNVLGAANISFFIDGVYVPGSVSGYNLDNLERIEVIRGPQSALFGRSTFAGAINYITRKPTDEFQGGAKLLVGQFNHRDTSAWMSGPIVEGVLRFSVNGRYMDKEGQYKNLVSGTNDMGGQRSKSAGVILDWTPAKWFDARLSINYSEDTDQLGQQVQLGGPGTGITAAELLNCYLPEPGTRRRGYRCGKTPHLDFLSANSINFAEAGLYPGRNLQQFNTYLMMNAYWNDYTFASTTSFFDTDSFGASDQDFSSTRGFGGAFESFGWGGSKTFTQELRIISPQSERFRWSAGLYYYDSEPDATSKGGSLVASRVPGAPDLPPNISIRTSDSKTQNEAVFASVAYDLLDNLTLTAEGRYSKDTIHAGGVSNFNKSSNTGFIPGSYSDGCTAVNAPIAGSPNRQQLSCTNEWSNDSTFKNFLPRLTATWFQTDELTWYAQYSKGNKPGGFNGIAESARMTPAARADLFTLGYAKFEEEEADSYEIGFKSRLFDERVQFNAALYLIDWTNQQLTQNAPVDEEGIPVGGTQPLYADSYVNNLGSAQIKGLELEMVTVLTDNWNLRLTYAYQDAKVKEFFSVDQADLLFPGPYTNCVEGTQCYDDYYAAGQMKGYTLPYVPENMASGSLSARYPIGDSSTFLFRTDYSYESSRYMQVHNLLKTGGSGVLNMTFGIERDAWNLSLWAKNLTDDRTIVTVRRNVDPTKFLVVPVQPGLPGTMTTTFLRDFAVVLANKRQFGMTLTYRFN